ncbi:MAG: winged helix-turn-helix transcriptional regulator [Methanoregula sp.]
MKQGKFFITFVIFTVVLCCICSPVIASGYDVQPAYGHTPEPIQDSSVPSSFWDQSGRIMTLHFVLLVSPLLLFPVELLFALKVFTVLGYRKIEKSAILYNENRRVIFEAIRSNPGIYFNELSRVTGINRGTLKYHLVVLKIKGKITKLGTTGSIRYFENSGCYSDLEKTLFRHLQETTSRKFLEIVSLKPHIYQKEIAEKIGISEPSVFWHMVTLEREGIVTTQRSGRHVRYELTTDAERILKKYYGKLLAPLGSTHISE